MLSKLFTRLNQTQSMTQLAQKAFRATPQMNKKPSIGDAVTILQSKVSNINQVVREKLPMQPDTQPQQNPSIQTKRRCDL